MTIKQNGGVFGRNPTFNDVEVENDLTSATIDLAAIATSKAVTAVDVFVYDTSLDSDGGAWRKRTQGTSWYNETLNTATRGSRRELPAVAVIVAEAAKVTIYDGDDPALPMWMVFSSATGNPVGGSGLTSVSAKNGKIAWGDSSLGLTYSDFTADKIRRHRSGAAAYNGWFLGAILDRNTASGWVGTGTPSTDYIVNSTVNDVAMTVRPTAPIDAATGLPVPTIAVATAGGVSVIKDDGTVEGAGTGFNVRGIAADTLGFTMVKSSSNTPYIRYAFGPTITETHSFSSYSAAAAGGYYVGVGSLWSDKNSVEYLQNDVFAVNSSEGLDQVLVGEYVADRKNKSLIARTTTDYATGYMVGDIKLATLSDTTAGIVPTTDFVVNGTFTTDTDWSKQTGWTIGSGVASCNGTNAVYLYQLSGLPANTQVVASIEITSYTSGSIRIGAPGVAPPTVLDSVGTHLVSFTTSSPGGGTEILSNSFVGSVDNVSVTAAVEDRSVNGNGLQVNGTITKTVVETGADLVAYSGFSASNYLEQPYNADLDFGTGDFSVMGWVKLTGADLQFLVYRGTASASFDIYVGSAYDITFRTPTKTLNVPSFTTVNTWAFCTCVRRNGVGYIYRNGELIGSNTDFGDSVTLADAYTRIGYRYDYPAIHGNMALWRISATAPTAEQIAKIYNDEKFLFQENAKATLDGASDEVTALAHDPVTDLLHVGTSAGRSVFQGLRRVDNTTTAVGTAISASNGLVVEE
jgi:trimeric autotransporter adhesin